MTRHPTTVLIALASLAALSCASGGASSSFQPPGPDAGSCPDVPAVPDVSCGNLKQVRLVALDIWGRRLPKWSAALGGSALGDSHDPAIEPAEAGQFDILASAQDHVAATARLTIDAESPAKSSAEVLTGGARTAVSLACVDGGMRLTAYLGLDHQWYAAGGRAPKPGNKVDLLMDGEEFWDSVLTSLAGATRAIRGTTWWWQSDFEMYRPEGHEQMAEGQRRIYTSLYVLDQVPAVKQILINRFTPETITGMAYVNTDPAIRQRGTTDGDGFEVLLQGNMVAVPFTKPWEGPAPAFSFAARVAASPEFAAEAFFAKETAVSAVLESLDAASYHQKGFVVDGRVAFISGMNVKSTDWDTNEHRVFDSRRMKFKTPSAERLRVKEKLQLPDLGPRKDYGIRVEGPAALDMDDALRVRWDQGIAEKAMFWEHASPFALDPYDGGTPGSVTCQITVTLPPPIQERSILETWAKALRNAKDFIYIEDQYWRMPILNDIVLSTMQERPQVRLIVVTKPISLTDGGKKWTVIVDKALREKVGDRYLLLQLKSFDAVPRPDPKEGDEKAQFYFEAMDTHSKMLIVDDVFMSVGSCNKNNRGLLYEGEMNVAVLDAALVLDARRRIFRNLVGPGLAEQVSDSAAENFALLEQTAEKNDAVEAWWLANGPGLAPAAVDAATAAHRPDGFMYSLAFTPDYLLDVGPDAY